MPHLHGPLEAPLSQVLLYYRRQPVADAHESASWGKDAVDFLDVLLDLELEVEGAADGVQGGLVEDQGEGVVREGHLADVHALEFHGRVAYVSGG